MRSDEAVLRKIIDGRAAAVRAGDVEGMTAAVADDVVMFDVVNPLRSTGRAAARRRAEQWLASYDGRPSWEDRDVRIVASDAVAFSHMLSHVTGKLKTGADVDMWFRTTLGLEKRDGRWLIVHEHGSDPFDVETGKASLNLKP